MAKYQKEKTVEIRGCQDHTVVTGIEASIKPSTVYVRLVVSDMVLESHFPSSVAREVAANLIELANAFDGGDYEK